VGFRGFAIAALVVASTCFTAGEARADIDTLFVDTTSDSSLTACTVAANDCSLRGAFANVDDGDLATDTDSIFFDATIFDGVETVPNEKTVVMASSGLVTDENLNLQALNSATHPSAGIDGPPGDIAIKVQDGVFDMRGIAIFDGNTGLQHSNTADGLTLKNDWFGLKLDGTPAGNQVGAYIAGPAADVGDPASTGNVFAANQAGLRLFGNGAQDIDVLNNRFGVKADGTVAANTLADIDIAGNVANQAPSNVDIGPFPGNATPACDEGCNVIAAAGTGATPGINLRGNLNPGETSTASNITIQNNHIGVNPAGTAATAGAAGDLIAVGAADGVIVNGNRIAGGVSAVNAGSEANDLLVEANTIGANADGTAVIDGTSNSAIAVSSSPTGPADIINNTIAADAAIDAMTVRGDGAEITSNRIGLPGVAGSGGFIGMRVEGSNHLIQGNSVGNVSGGAIFLTEITAAEVKQNEVGEIGPVGGSGISINSGPGSSTGNAIGSNDPNLANVFGDIGGDAIMIEGDGNDGNQILANVGGDAGGLFIDLEGAPGPGNGLQGPNQGVEAPKVKRITAKSISGTAGPSGQVRIYRSGSSKGKFPRGLKKLIGTKTVKPDGTWKLKPGGTIKKSWVITTNQTDSAGNGSELSKGKSRRR
jgi:hypothetical protein